MQVEVILPKVGMAMQDAVIVSWLKREGETVQKDDPLFEMETEKVVETVNAPVTGILVKINYPEGETVEVEAVVAIIQISDENSAITAAASQPAATLEIKPAGKPPASSEQVASGKQTGDDLRLGGSLPLSRMRQTISRRMHESLSSSAQLTLMREVDITKIVEKREQVLKQQEVTYTDIFVFVVAREIARFPIMNGRLENDKLVIHPVINIGIAAAMEEGLIVPVIKKAEQKTLLEITAERQRLVNAVRSGAFTSDDVSEGTFTVTNLGTFGIDMFTPIINLPEVAILGVGRIVKKPVVVGEEIKVCSMMGLSLTIDHRVIDGAPGAEFLAKVSEALSNADF